MHSNVLQNEAIFLRTPRLGDGAAIHELVKDSPPLDVNSRYCYLLLCDHFGESCIIAECKSNIVGFISAYGHPQKQDTLFVWQVAVTEGMRGQGLAGVMLDRILSNSGPWVTFVETTVTPSNRLSLRFFQTFAERRNVSCRQQMYMKSDLFGNDFHEDEFLLRIGPLKYD
jgi:L-2,4-diaminobutyric acid acetyltransferase